MEVLEFDSWRGLGIFSLHHRVQNGSEYQGLFPWGLKTPEHEADHSPPSSAEVKECVDICHHSPNTPSWGGARLKRGTETPLLLPVSLLLNSVSNVIYVSAMNFLQDQLGMQDKKTLQESVIRTPYISHLLRHGECERNPNELNRARAGNFSLHHRI
jgi:hypothetical protein